VFAEQPSGAQRNGWTQSLAAADELDNLQAVVVLELSGGPLLPPHNLVIQFHGDTIPLQLEVLQQLHDAQRGGKLLRLSIDYNFH